MCSLLPPATGQQMSWIAARRVLSTNRPVIRRLRLWSVLCRPPPNICRHLHCRLRSLHLFPSDRSNPSWCGASSLFVCRSYRTRLVLANILLLHRLLLLPRLYHHDSDGHMNTNGTVFGQQFRKLGGPFNFKLKLFICDEKWLLPCVLAKKKC